MSCWRWASRCTHSTTIGWQSIASSCAAPGRGRFRRHWTGSPAAWYSCRRRAMFSNWALRSGWCPMVFFFRAVRRPSFSWRSNRRSVRRLAGVPSSASRRDSSRSDKFVHNTPWRIGSPAVNSSSSRCRLAIRGGHVSVNGRRPPLFFGPGRPPHPRALPTLSGPAESSSDRTPRGG